MCRELESAERFVRTSPCGPRDALGTLNSPPTRRDHIDKQWKDIEMVVGMAIIEKKLNGKQLVSAWDRSGTGEVSKVEFRKGVAYSLNIHVEMKFLNELFDRIDEDGGVK